MSIINKASEILFENSDIDTDFIHKSLDNLKSRSIDFGDLFFERVVSESMSIDESIIKGGSFDIFKGVGVRAVNGEKCGFAYSDVLNQKSISDACMAAKSISRSASQNKACSLEAKDKTPLYTSDDPIISIGRERKAQILESVDKMARALDEKVVQVNASINASHRIMLVANTDGTFCADIKPISVLAVSVVVKSGDKIEMGFSSTGGAYLQSEFTDDVVASVVKEAVRSALVNLEAVAAPAGCMNVVLGAGWPGVLVHEAVGHGLEGDFNRTGSSLFSGRIGDKVASSACTIIDDGTMPDRRGSMTFDDEGIESSCNVLIENGILKGYMQDRQNAMLMGGKPTGNGRRQAYNYLPQVRMTNTYMAPGAYDKEEIISSVKNGIYAVNFSGGQVDITSGKFVFSTSEAYLIENGKIGAPIKGATLIGNGPETMNQVSMVGNDLEFDKGVGMCGKGGQSVPVGIGQPTVKLDAITVGGTSV